MPSPRLATPPPGAKESSAAAAGCMASVSRKASVTEGSNAAATQLGTCSGSSSSNYGMRPAVGRLTVLAARQRVQLWLQQNAHILGPQRHTLFVHISEMLAVLCMNSVGAACLPG